MTISWEISLGRVKVQQGDRTDSTITDTFSRRAWLIYYDLLTVTLLGTNISPPKGTFEDDFPFL